MYFTAFMALATCADATKLMLAIFYKEQYSNKIHFLRTGSPLRMESIGPSSPVGKHNNWYGTVAGALYR